ncbi:MAG: hypothetical protein K8R89_03225 [Anaerolineae bacterium]|nr:hypothetical protein [Anaerolineae bacterium]
MNIGTVVEGPTDELVLKAVIGYLHPGQHRFFPLQPISVHSERGNGWKGIRRWCKETWQRAGSDLEKIISADTGPPLDLLVIMLDADIVTERDLQDNGLTDLIRDVQPVCPPIATTVTRLEQVVCRWFQRSIDQLPSAVLLVFPAQDLENWTFAALYPDDPLCNTPDYECVHQGHDRDQHPAYQLTLKKYGRYLGRRGNTIRKSVSKYRPLASQITTNWMQVCRICTQAQHFEDDLRAKFGDVVD